MRVAVRDGRARVLFPALLVLAALAFALGACRVHARADATPPASRCDGATARVPYDQRTFLGYACRDDDCGAHKAGFAWADRIGVTDPADCAGAEDPAFAEGCRVFVQDAVTAEQAGFQWARENEVDDRCRCSGAGPRFEAGCEAYVMIVR
jgi:hypothetical protein